MMKIALAVAAAAAVLTTAPLVTPAKAQGVKMAQGVDVPAGSRAGSVAATKRQIAPYSLGASGRGAVRTASFSNRGKCPWSCGRAPRSLG